MNKEELEAEIGKTERRTERRTWMVTYATMIVLGFVCLIDALLSNLSVGDVALVMIIGQLMRIDGRIRKAQT